MDYEARKKPESFKPAIDDALMRIGRLAEADSDAVAAKLGELEPEGGPWHYLKSEALPAVRDMIVNDKVREALNYSWGQSLLEDTLTDNLRAFYAVETEADVDPDDWERPVVLEYYPEEAHECLRQGNYIGGSDADIIALWRRDDRNSVCHAHMEGFWILGEDPIDWIENIAMKAEEKLANQ